MWPFMIDQFDCFCFNLSKQQVEIDRNRFLRTGHRWRLIEPICSGGAKAPGWMGRARGFSLAPYGSFAVMRLGMIFSLGFGNWNLAAKRFRRWVQADVFKSIFYGLNDKPNLEYAKIDATTVKVHCHAMGLKDEAGPSRWRRSVSLPQVSARP
jgi:hypothetical protein